MQTLAEIQLIYKPSLKEAPVVKSAHDAYLTLLPFYPEETISLIERVVVIYLNNSNRVLGVHELSSGGRTSCLIDIRILLATALKACAVSLILSHNHPSYTTVPSEQDKRITQKVVEAGNLLDIKILDHLIVSPNNDYFSFADEGLL